MASLDELRSTLAADAAEIIGRYPQPRSALMPLLHLAQAEVGYVSEDGIRYVAEQLGFTEAYVAAVASFYTMYKRRPPGEFHVGVCTNSLCAVMGGDAIFADLQEHLEIGNDETTADGKVSLEHLECNAACDYAPVVMVNWEFFDNMTPQSARDLVDGLRTGAGVTPPAATPPATRAWPACARPRSRAGRRTRRTRRTAATEDRGDDHPHPRAHGLLGPA